MSEWKNWTLRDFMYLNPQTPLKKGTIAKKVGMEYLVPFSKKITGCDVTKYVSGTKFVNGDTLLARITPCLENGKSAYVDILTDEEIAFGSTEYIVLREKQDISNSQFIYYLATSPDFRDIAIQLMTGSSGRQRVEADALGGKVFSFPDLFTQRAIACVLSSLDDKIDLLTRQNATLEALAQTYFRQWFVEDNEEIGNLGDYITLFDSKRIPLSAMERVKKQDGKLYPYYGAATIMDYVNDYIFDGEYILLGEDGTVQTDDGYPALQYATGKFWCNNHAHVIQAKKPYTNYTLWCFLKQCNITNVVTGAVQPKINQENLRSIAIPIPPLGNVDIANTNIDVLFKKIMANNAQILTLQKLRDTLLPKLISGEVRVKQGGDGK